MAKEKINPFDQIAAQRTAKTKSVEESSNFNTNPPKRGRPATGKRSDPDWIGRTYYIRRETDLDVEEELHRLKRDNQAVDKSELVDFLLSEWVKSQQGGQATFRLGGMSAQ
jgi:hypothetical protein